MNALGKIEIRACKEHSGQEEEVAGSGLKPQENLSFQC